MIHTCRVHLRKSDNNSTLLVTIGPWPHERSAWACSVFTHWESTRFAVFTILWVQRDHLTYANQQNEAGSVHFLAGCKMYGLLVPTHHNYLPPTDLSFGTRVRNQIGWQKRGLMMQELFLLLPTNSMPPALLLFSTRKRTLKVKSLCDLHNRKGAEFGSLKPCLLKWCPYLNVESNVALHNKNILSVAMSFLTVLPRISLSEVQFNPIGNMVVMYKEEKKTNYKRSHSHIG